MNECNRCGKCCFIPTEKKGFLRACRWLVKLGEKYHCRIYKDRLYRFIGEANGKKYYCNMYNDLKFEIESCPINVGGKPVREVEIIKHKLAEEKWLGKHKN